MEEFCCDTRDGRVDEMRTQGDGQGEESTIGFFSSVFTKNDIAETTPFPDSVRGQNVFSSIQIILPRYAHKSSFVLGHT